MSDKLLSFSNMLQEQDEKWSTSRPEVVDQTTTVVDQTTSRPVDQNYKSRTERTKIGVRLPAHKVEKYKLWCFVNKVSLQDAIEKGMDWVTGRPDDQTTTINDLDDLDDIKTDDALIFYRRWTKNQLTDKDREAYEEVRHLAPHVIKSGILVSVVRSKSKIRSFRYCLGAILETAESNPSESYFEYLLEQLRHKM